MRRADAAIIGGTGVGEVLRQMPGIAFCQPTPFGSLRGKLIDWEGMTLAVVARHSAGHKLPPHRVGYRSFASGLKSMGVRACFASAAVGCLHPEWGVGHLAACTDMIDFSGRNITLYEDSVKHTPVGRAFPLAHCLVRAAEKVNEPIHPSAVYAGVNGPRYETPSEIAMFAKHKCDVVGMTAHTEAVVMAEAEIPYSCLAVVTNLAEGLSANVIEHGGVADVMKDKSDVLVRLLLEAARISLSETS